uniref:RBR-type E3 ubiquitin transferase n=1 Tax=Aegilops tauschii TaxID=37682 RepID=M8CGQ7_AEGTA
MAGDDDLAALHEQAALASSAAVSASDLDFAFQLQVAEAIQASLRANSDPSSSSSAAAAAAASSPFQSAPVLESSDVAYALAVHAADLARAEEDRLDAQRLREAHAQAAATVRIAAHDAAFARELASIPEDQWARDGDHIERPLDPTKRVRPPGKCGAQDTEAGGSICGWAHDARGDGAHRRPRGGSWVGDPKYQDCHRLQGAVQPCLGVICIWHCCFLMPRMFDIVSFSLIALLGIWRPTQKKLAAMIDQVLSVRKKFKQCEVLFVERRQLEYVMKLARESVESQLAKAITVHTGMEMRENCAICLEDTDVSKIHAVEGRAHRFCFSCMKEHVKVKLLHGMLPACPQDGCTKQLTVEGSKVFLSPRLLGIMVQRIREAQIPPTQKIYCPYPKCSALMSLSEVIQPMQESCSKYTVADSATLRKCVKCRGSFCISCRVPWHDRMTCQDYKMMHPHAHSGDAKLENLAERRLWRKCVKCQHMIELAEGCYHMTCVCGYEFCYTCGKEWKDKKPTCSCPLWDERNIIRNDIRANVVRENIQEDEDEYDDDEDHYYVQEGVHYNQGFRNCIKETLAVSHLYDRLQKRHTSWETSDHHHAIEPLLAYPTTMFGQNDDEGVILVLYFKISDSFDKEISPQLRDNIKSVMNEEMMKVKGVPGGQKRALHREAENSGRHCEPQDLQLSAVEGRLVQSYNQKPVLSRPQHKFYKLY